MAGGEGEAFLRRLRDEFKQARLRNAPYQAIASGVSNGQVTIREIGADEEDYAQPAMKLSGVVVEQEDRVLVLPVSNGEQFVVVGAIDDGSVRTELELPAQIRSTGNVPSLSILLAAGSSASGSISGTDTAGIIQLTPSGSGIATGNIMTVTFSTPRPGGNYAIALTPFSAAARALTNIGPASRSGAAFSVTVGDALTSESNYQWLYLICGY